MKKKTLFGVLLAIMLAISMVVPVSAGSANVPDEAAMSNGQNEGRYIVVFEDFVDPVFTVSELGREHGIQVGYVYQRALRGFSGFIPAGELADLRADPRVKVIEPDLVAHAVADPQPLPTGVDRIDTELNGVAMIDGLDERVDVDIAVIDTGIDTDHPDLNVVGGRHFYSIAGILPRQDDAYDDDNGHGSHCAGIAAAIDNTIGVVGVAPGARLWAVKVLNSKGSGYVSDIIAGVDWVTQRSSEIEVANMSLGFTGNSASLRLAIQNSVAAGVVYMVAAGNAYADVYGPDNIFGTSDDFQPAAYPEVAAISAMVDSDGQPGGLGSSTGYGLDDSFAAFSNYSRSVVSGNPVTSPGAAIDLMMPGVNIYSTYKNGGYATMSGTSMASPHAAGLAALYIAAYGRAANAASVYTIRQALIDSGMPQSDAEKGLTTQNDPDNNKENLGWAGQAGTSNSPPVAVDDSAVTDEDIGVTINVLDNDRDDNGDVLTVSTVSSPLHGIYYKNVDNTVTYVPSAEYYGTDSFSYTVSDGHGGTDTAIVNLDIYAVNDAPVAVAGGPYSGTIGELISFDGSGSYDVDSPILSYTWTFGDDTTGTGETITHSFDREGTYEVSLTVGDGPISSISTTTVIITADVVQTMHVESIVVTYTKTTVRRSTYYSAIATVKVVDSDGMGLLNVKVNGHWSGLTGDIDSGITIDGGTVVLVSNSTKKTGTFIFTIDSVEGSGYVFDRTIGILSGSVIVP